MAMDGLLPCADFQIIVSDHTARPLHGRALLYTVRMPPRYGSLAEALEGTTAPHQIISALALIDVPYIDFEGKSQKGQLVVHEALAEEIAEIFSKLHAAGFPIAKIVPIAAYDWDDEASMADNNTSAFNYREILGTGRLSNHSYGRAIDINPLLNPYHAYDGKVYPDGAAYVLDIPGTLAPDGLAVTIFKEYRWKWLGDRADNADYQHFEKPLP